MSYIFGMGIVCQARSQISDLRDIRFRSMIFSIEENGRQFKVQTEDLSRMSGYFAHLNIFHIWLQMSRVFSHLQSTDARLPVREVCWTEEEDSSFQLFQFQSLWLIVGFSRFSSLAWWRLGFSSELEAFAWSDHGLEGFGFPWGGGASWQAGLRGDHPRASRNLKLFWLSNDPFVLEKPWWELAGWMDGWREDQPFK